MSDTRRAWQARIGCAAGTAITLAINGEIVRACIAGIICGVLLWFWE